MPVASEADLVPLRRQARAMAARLGFGPADRAVAVLAVTELAANILAHAGQGAIALGMAADRPGLRISASDAGPGIPDPRSWQDGNAGAGIGLAGIRRLMDTFSVESQAGRGTVVVVERWLR